MHNAESVRKNGMHKLLWDFKIQTDYMISARRSDLEIVTKNKKKRICQIEDFAVPADLRVKLRENEKRENIKTLLEN